MNFVAVRYLTRFACLVLPALAACSLSPAISHDVTDYYRVNDLAANRIILLNILRARDGLPLHFSELSQIRGQLSAGAAGAVNFPFGSQSDVTNRPAQTAALGVTVSSAPSFDIVSLDTKDFTEGVMSPIDPQTVRFFMDEGVDYRMVLMLLASGVRQAGSDEMLLNAPASSRIVCYKTKPAVNALPDPDQYTIQESDQPCKGYREAEFYSFLRVLNNTGRLYAIDVRPSPRPVGAPFAIHMNRDLSSVTSLDPAKYFLRPVSSGRFQLMARSPYMVMVLCRETSSGPQVASVLSIFEDVSETVPADACNPNLAAQIKSQRTSTGVPLPGPVVHVGTTPGTFIVKLRSTLEVIQYLGEILAFQQQHDRCITVQYEPIPAVMAQHTFANCNRGALFHLVNPGNSKLASNIGINYGGRTWALPVPRRCVKIDRCDHTLETMSMISLLLDKNKSAKDILRTPAVQAVP